MARILTGVGPRSARMLWADGFRGMDLLSPIWHFLDLTPEGRGDYFPAKQYD